MDFLSSASPAQSASESPVIWRELEDGKRRPFPGEPFIYLSYIWGFCMSRCIVLGFCMNWLTTPTTWAMSGRVMVIYTRLPTMLLSKLRHIFNELAVLWSESMPLFYRRLTRPTMLSVGIFFFLYIVPLYTCRTVSLLFDIPLVGK